MASSPKSKKDRYPYQHQGPSVYSSKFIDYLISEIALREDHPELFKEEPNAIEDKETS